MRSLITTAKEIRSASWKALYERERVLPRLAALCSDSGPHLTSPVSLLCKMELPDLHKLLGGLKEKCLGINQQ